MSGQTTINDSNDSKLQPSPIRLASSSSSSSNSAKTKPKWTLQWRVQTFGATTQAETEPLSNSRPRRSTLVRVKDEPSTGTNLYITGLPDDCTESALHQVFSTFGRIVAVRLHHRHPERGPYALCRFEHADAASRARSALHGTCLSTDKDDRNNADGNTPDARIMVIRFAQSQTFGTQPSKPSPTTSQSQSSPTVSTASAPLSAANAALQGNYYYMPYMTPANNWMMPPFSISPIAPIAPQWAIPTHSNGVLIPTVHDKNNVTLEDPNNENSENNENSNENQNYQVPYNGEGEQDGTTYADENVDYGGSYDYQDGGAYGQPYETNVESGSGNDVDSSVDNNHVEGGYTGNGYVEGDYAGNGYVEGGYAGNGYVEGDYTESGYFAGDSTEDGHTEHGSVEYEENGDQATDDKETDYKESDDKENDKENDYADYTDGPNAARFDSTKMHVGKDPLDLLVTSSAAVTSFHNQSAAWPFQPTWNAAFPTRNTMSAPSMNPAMGSMNGLAPGVMHNLPSNTSPFHPVSARNGSASHDVMHTLPYKDKNIDKALVSSQQSHGLMYNLLSNDKKAVQLSQPSYGIVQNLPSKDDGVPTIMQPHGFGPSMTIVANSMPRAHHHHHPPQMATNSFGQQSAQSATTCSSAATKTHTGHIPVVNATVVPGSVPLQQWLKFSPSTSTWVPSQPPPMPSFIVPSPTSSTGGATVPVPTPAVPHSSRNMSVSPIVQQLLDSAEIYVYSLPLNVQERDLYSAFQSFGPILSIRIKRQNNGQFKCGWVIFRHVVSAETALAYQVLPCRWARPRKTFESKVVPSQTHAPISVLKRPKHSPVTTEIPNDSQNAAPLSHPKNGVTAPALPNDSQNAATNSHTKNSIPVARPSSEPKPAIPPAASLIHSQNGIPVVPLSSNSINGHATNGVPVAPLSADTKHAPAQSRVTNGHAKNVSTTITHSTNGATTHSSDIHTASHSTFHGTTATSKSMARERTKDHEGRKSRKKGKPKCHTRGVSPRASIETTTVSVPCVVELSHHSSTRLS